MSFEHRTVMLHETIEAVAPKSGGVYADVTLGGGGHTEAILEASAPDGVVIGVDRDPDALEAARIRLATFGARMFFVHGTMADLPRILGELGFDLIDGVVADLGVSSPQLDRGEQGFSFANEGPLDMRMDPTDGVTAKELIQQTREEDLADILYQYGEERRSRKIARVIKEAARAGEMESTGDLRRAVHRAIGRPPGKIDPATRTFQAIRIAVNGELDQLEQLIERAPEILRDGGIIAIIAFHSLEDRIVKHAFRSEARLDPLYKRPLVATEEEKKENPRARSAKLRAARRVVRAAA